MRPESGEGVVMRLAGEEQAGKCRYKALEHEWTWSVSGTSKRSMWQEQSEQRQEE